MLLMYDTAHSCLLSTLVTNTTYTQAHPQHVSSILHSEEQTMSDEYDVHVVDFDVGVIRSRNQQSRVWRETQAADWHCMTCPQMHMQSTRTITELWTLILFLLHPRWWHGPHWTILHHLTG